MQARECAPWSTGPLFYDDHSVNLYHLNEVYQNVAAKVAKDSSKAWNLELDISSGIWGGTYLIADKEGKSRRRIWRFYCMLNLPQDSPLDDQGNMEKFIALYTNTLVEAFGLHGLKLELKMWGGRLPFSNKKRPNMTLHMEDSTERIRWLRPIICWNSAPWETSIIYDSLRLIKELKQNLNLDKGPTLTDPQEIKYMLQDVIITHLTLKEAHDRDFMEHAEPIIDKLMGCFMKGLHEKDEIVELYNMVLNNALVYGFEQTMEAYYQKEGLNVKKFEDWPAEKINFVPASLQEKLVPPIKNIMTGFRSALDQKYNS